MSFLGNICVYRYRLRSKVEIQNVAEEFTCWQRFGDKIVANSSSESPANGNNFGYSWYKDPRLECLGFRGIFPSDTIRKTGKKIFFA